MRVKEKPRAGKVDQERRDGEGLDVLFLMVYQVEWILTTVCAKFESKAEFSLKSLLHY